MRHPIALVVAVAVVARVTMLPNVARAATTLLQLEVTVGRGTSSSSAKVQESFVVARPNAVTGTTCWLSKETASGKAVFDGACSYGEVLAFSKNRGATWNSAANPTLGVTLGTRRNVNLNIHLFVEKDSAAVWEKRIAAWVTKARTIFGATNPIGLTFSSSTTWHTEAAGDLVGEGCDANRGAKASSTSLYYVANQITVYVVSGVYEAQTPLQGVKCATPSNLIYLSQAKARSVALAHEIGHVLGLHHALGALAADESKNLMVDVPRSAFNLLTAGQAVRTLLDTRSWLNASTASFSSAAAVPNASRANCDTSTLCPADTLEWTKLP
jgi:hypothetical protein